MQTFHGSDTSLWLWYEHKNSSLWKTMGFSAMYKTILCRASAQCSLHNRQQTASASHRFGLCLVSWFAPSGFFLLTNVVDEHRLPAPLGILFKDGRRGAAGQWLSPLYCSLLHLPSCQPEQTLVSPRLCPTPQGAINKKKGRFTRYNGSATHFGPTKHTAIITVVPWGANARGQDCTSF